MPEIRLTCISPESAAIVTKEVKEANDPDDILHIARQDGAQVVISYVDPHFPMDLASWAGEHGHAHGDDAGRVIAAL